MAKYMIDSSTLTAIADEIRAKTGSSEQLDPADFADEIESIETGGGDTLQEAVSGTLTEWTDTETQIIDDARIGFMNGLSISKLTMSVLRKINALQSFNGNANIKELSCPRLTQTKNYAFMGAKGLTTVDLPLLDTTGGGIFRECTSLLHVNMPALTKIAWNSFLSAGASGMTLEFPAVTVVESLAFGLSKLKEITLPACTTIGPTAFKGCTELERINLPGSTVATLMDQTAFTNDIGVEVCVPANLIASYQADTNWAAAISAGQVNIVALTGEVQN